jgi:hypothetical protein
MANTYRWYINELDVMPDFNGYNNFITRIIWRYNATNQDGINVNLEGQLTFNEENGQEPYLPYNSITEQEVIDWLNTYQDVASLQAQLDKMMDEKVNPTIVNLPLPWESQ